MVQPAATDPAEQPPASWPPTPGPPSPWHWTWAPYESLSKDDLYDALALRCRVFILEQGPFLDPDGVDRQSWHLLARDPAGVARLYLRVVEPGVAYAESSIGRVVVDLSVRGTGAGRLLMRHGLRQCQVHWPEQGVRISAQARLRRFYTELGFAAVGEEYIEDDIPHVQMLRPAGLPVGQSELSVPNTPVKDVRWVVIHHPGPAWEVGLPLTQQVGVMAHVRHYQPWADSGRLACGGPFLDAAGGGMMLCRAGVEESALREFARADPAVQSGLLSFELRPWQLGIQG